jgi:outer membrane protein assembly factor BamB
MNEVTAPLPSQPQQPAPAETASPGPAAAPRAPVRVRLWPALIIVALQWVMLKAPGWFAPGTPIQFFGMMLAPLVGFLGILCWWLFASRIPWRQRFLGLGAFVLVGAVAYMLFDPTFDLMGVFFVTLPISVTTMALWLLVTPFLSWPVRRAGLLVVVVLTWGYFDLLRFDGTDGNISATMSWRWVPTDEDNYRTTAAAASTAVSTQSLILKAGDWPGFRGPNRDGRLTGVRIATNWEQHPPRRLWKHLIGPGWSSFAVVGKHLFTQEQLDDQERVVCFDANNGDVIWIHSDPARFMEKIGGPGPRATPTFHGGKLYTFGATGLLNCLDAATGKKLWGRNIVTDFGPEVPIWGFASSPLVAEGLVTVFAGAAGNKSALAYNADSGKPAWQAGEGQLSYSSLHPARLGGVDQLLLATDQGLTAFKAARGDVLWNHAWDTGGMQRVVQPTLVGDSDVLIGSPFGKGTRRVHVTKQGSSWETQEVWTSRAISPYFNDGVVHGKHLYGIDTGGFLTCVNLDDGKRKWRSRDYGSGQLLLLVDQDLLVVVAETGFVALVEAKPDEHHEVARFQALTGKTWNHPVLAHGRLFVRNGAEVACFELPAIGSVAAAGKQGQNRGKVRRRLGW